MKLISINIEQNKHFEHVIPFIERELPDVLCIQELFRSDFHRFTELGYTGTFLPMRFLITNGAQEEMGIALFSRIKTKNIHTFYYSGDDGKALPFVSENLPNSGKRGVIFADVLENNQVFKVGTTHFTWTPDALRPCQKQSKDLESFLSRIATTDPHIICGDFNIPRNVNSLYDSLKKTYTDTIPLQYKTSLDKVLHRCGPQAEKSHLFEKYMVDYVFTQPPYVATDVRLAFGLSDHAALVATITQ